MSSRSRRFYAGLGRYIGMPASGRMNGSIGRISAAIRAAEILSIALIAGCSVPSVTNVTPVVTGEASAIAGTQFPAGAEPVAIAITPDGGNLDTANLRDGTI